MTSPPIGSALVGALLADLSTVDARVSDDLWTLRNPEDARDVTMRLSEDELEDWVSRRQKSAHQLLAAESAWMSAIALIGVYILEELFHVVDANAQWLVYDGEGITVADKPRLTNSAS
ncbi:MAG: hypothetical protein EOO27_25500 [Comamonadaceae bacterium]|nr:MAG: hypothetical protein EOO27_25500 [Comamonadaceae bacterium]